MPDYQPAGKHALRFDILPVRPVIAYFRICHGDNLSGITGIAEYFLITGHARIKNELACMSTACAKAAAGKSTPVFQGQQAGMFRRVTGSRQRITHLFISLTLFT